jgi:asparagine N-glycosylation enzyme membrane subunit Stt3
MDQAKSSIDPPEEWLEACQWLGSQTPDPGMDFNGIYEAAKEDVPFQYPDTAYGVM